MVAATTNKSIDRPLHNEISGIQVTTCKINFQFPFLGIFWPGRSQIDYSEIDLDASLMS
jgi:hypothetical protein